MSDYKVISSASNGNAIIYENSILVDAGVPYTALHEHLASVKVALLTHRHADHFNPSTIKRIQKNYPNITFICGIWLKDLLDDLEIKKVIILDFDKTYNLGFCKLSLVKAYHDCPNCGYRILINDKKYFHLTDSGTLDGISAKGYDYYFIEGNYLTETIDREIEEAQAEGKFTYKIGAKNSHLSIEQANEFIANNAKDGSEVHLLHTSKQYLNTGLELDYIYKKEVKE